jgi:hypothetical protein
VGDAGWVSSRGSTSKEEVTHPGVQERKGTFKGPFPAFRCKPPAVDCLCDVVYKAYDFLKGEAPGTGRSYTNL